MYFLAIFLPSLAVFLCGKPVQALLLLVAHVTVIGWIPASMYALMVVKDTQDNKRTNQIVGAIERGSATAPVPSFAAPLEPVREVDTWDKTATYVGGKIVDQHPPTIADRLSKLDKPIFRD
jgi:uncharacterized membrane protein YqaE (UPF0057 family)